MCEWCMPTENERYKPWWLVINDFHSFPNTTYTRFHSLDAAERHVERYCPYGFIHQEHHCTPAPGLPRVNGEGRLDLSLTRTNLRALRRYFFPGGSGDLAMMRTFCRLLDAVADDKGWDIGQNTSPLYPQRKKKRR